MILAIRIWHVARANYAEFARLSEEEFWPVFEGFEGRAPENTAGVYIREQFRVEPERIERFRKLTEDI